MNNIIEYMQQENIGEIKENVSFKALTTFKVGGNALYVVFPNNVENLIKLLNKLKDNNICFKILGNGSNIIPSDNNYKGVIIKLSNLNDVKIDKDKVIVGAGYSLQKLANDLSKAGYTGLEWACGIPGTIGGAVYMNAGAYKSSISDVLDNAILLDDNYNLITFYNSDFLFSYRKSVLMDNKYICLSATFNIKKGNQTEIMNLIADRRQRRMQSQPLEYPSAGSVFRNPTDDYAGRLVEECGLKGYKIGGAMISDKHANFIVNTNNATSKDIKELIDLTKFKVKDKFNIELKPEQEFFNWE